MGRMELAQKVLDQMTDLYNNNNIQLSPEERKKLKADFERNMEKLSQYTNESRIERVMRNQESQQNENSFLLVKLAAELEEIREQLSAMQREEIEDTTHFGFPARFRRLEQLLATNTQDIKTCWERLGELEGEISRLK